MTRSKASVSSPSCPSPRRRASGTTHSATARLLLATASFLFTLSRAGLCQDQAPGARAKPTEPIHATVVGRQSVWTIDRPVAETDRDELFQTERWGPAFSYRFSHVPPGPCTVRLGFNENKWTRPGQRAFDISINGAVVWPAFDILAHGLPNEAVIVASPVNVPDNGSLEIAFRARVDNAKINFVRLCGETWSAETSPTREDRVRFLQPDPEAAWMLNLHETTLGRFGSRVAINPRPQKGLFLAGPMGHADYNVAYFEKTPELYQDPPVNHYFVVGSGDRQYGLPFNPDVPVFPSIKQRQGMTWLEYEASSPDLPVRARFRFEAPFYPQDAKLSCAPYLRLRVTLENTTGRRVPARLVVAREQRPGDEVGSARLADHEGLVFRAPVFGLSTDWYWLAPSRPDRATISSSIDIAGVRRSPDGAAPQTDAEGRAALPILWDRPLSGLNATVTLEPFSSVEVPLLWVAWVRAPVLEALGKTYRFMYTDLFESPEAVVRYGEEAGADIARRTDLFESTVMDATVPQALKDLLAFAFQSWVMNTWYLVGEDGQEWFSVWEGCCKFHSTVDVEYNVAPLYFQYWPDLMKLTLLEWVGRIQDGVLPHDMGMGLKANGMDYGHHMEVEENTNFVLLLHQYWKYTGDDALVRRLMDGAAELLQYVLDADTDEDGFVERGTSNTIDQGSTAIQHAPDQTYLAVRSLTAFRAGAEMALLAGREDLAGRWREQADLVARTLDREGWLGDHYVVDLNQAERFAAAPAPTAGPANPGARDGDPGAAPPYYEDGPPATAGRMTGRGQYDPLAGAPGAPGPGEWDPWRTSPSKPQPPRGWDAYSVYTTNGLLYPFRAGMALPGLDLTRVRTDLGRAAVETLRLYGSPHTSQESNMWVSQNLWRDAAAAYLGVDLVDNVDRYWALQLHFNRTKRGCFTDVYNYGSGSLSLDYYPRGVAAFALVQALGGISFDLPAGRLSVMALRSPLRLPLTALADWDAEQVPWIVLERTGLDTRGRIEGPTRVPIRLESRPFGEPW